MPKKTVKKEETIKVPSVEELVKHGMNPRLAKKISKLPPKEYKAQIASAALELERRKREERMRYYEPVNDNQRRVWTLLSDPKLRILVVAGGNQSGKTEEEVEAAAMLLYGEGPLAHRFPNRPIHIRQGSPDFMKGIKTTLIPKWKEVIRRDGLRGGSWQTAYSAGDVCLYMQDGSFVEWMTYGQDTEVWQAAQRHVIIFDEWPTYGIWRESKMRMLRHGGLIMVAATPTAGTQEAWQMKLVADIEAGHIPNAAVVHLDTLENPYIDQAWLAQEMAEMSDDEIAMRIKGLFIALGGKVLPEFDPRIHVIPSFVPPDGAPTCVALDVHSNKANYGNFAALLTHETCRVADNWLNGEVKWEVPRGETQLHIWEEFTCDGTIEKTCEYLGMASGGRMIDSFLIERSVKTYDSNTGIAEYREFKKHWPFVKWNADAIGGRAILRALCRVDETTKRTRLYVHKNCEITRDQLISWSYKDPTRGGEMRPEEVRKVNDDMCDCIRAHGQWFKGHYENQVSHHNIIQRRMVVVRDPVTNARCGYRILEGAADYGGY